MQLLTRLNAKAGISEGFGGIPELTTSDICAALAGANKAGLAFLIARDAGLPENCLREYEAICGHFEKEVHKLAKRLKWPLRNSGTAKLVVFTRIQLAESIAGTRCPSCRGTRYSLIHPSELCRTCRGTGVYVLEDRIKANLMQISPPAYHKTWYPREKEVKMLFERRIYSAEKSIYSKLYEALT